MHRSPAQPKAEAWIASQANDYEAGKLVNFAIVLKSEETLGGSMGLTTWAAFSGSDELAAVDGDFIMTAKEVQPVLQALRKAGIHIVARSARGSGSTL